MLSDHAPGFTGPELCRLSACDVVTLLQKGEVSPKELLDAAFSRIDTVESAVNAMPTICPERAYAAAEALPSDGNRAGWLAGLPLGIKDLDNVAGVRTTFGTKARADFVPDTSDHFVNRIERNGGIVVGKTNTPEMGAGANTFNSVFGATRNPWNTALNPAGSSGGAAASLATGETWLSQGSDHGGSLRTPAAYCGVVGLRTVPGRVAGSLVAGKSAGWITEGVLGPMARSVADCALFLDAMAGFEASVPLSLPDPSGSFLTAVERATPKIRVAFAPDLDGLCPVEPVIHNALNDAMQRVEKAGGTVVEACPDLAGLETTYRCLRGVGMATSLTQLPDEVTRHFKDTLKRNLAFGRSLTIKDIAAAHINRTTLFLEMERFLRDFDVLACPVVGAMPRAAEIEWVDEIEGETFTDYMSWLKFAFLATTTGLPAISVPVGLSDEGIPIGVQLIGRPQGEAGLLAAARAVEMAVGGPLGPIDPIRKTG